MRSFSISSMVGNGLLGLSALIPVAAGQSQAISPSSINCRQEAFAGFDSRLLPSVVAKFPMNNEQPVGFSVLDGHPIVAFAHRLMVPGGSLDEVSAVPSFKTIRYLLSSASEVHLGNPDGLQKFGPRSLESETVANFDKDAMLAQSSTPLVMTAVQRGARVEYAGWTSGGNRLPLFGLEGVLHRLSWTPSGLATIVGNSLYTFDSGASRLQATEPDPMLGNAVDLCMVGPGRAVVMYPHTIVLYGGNQRTILVAFSGRCAWDGESLFLLDVNSGIVWKVQNIEPVGKPADTRQFVQQLIDKGKAHGEGGNRSFRELARLIGFQRASALTGHPNPCVLGNVPKPLLAPSTTLKKRNNSG